MKNKLVLVFTLALAIIVALPVAQVSARQSVATGNPIPTKGNVFAVVIGINTYLYRDHDRNYCVANADAFAAMVETSALGATVVEL